MQLWVHDGYDIFHINFTFYVKDSGVFCRIILRTVKYMRKDAKGIGCPLVPVHGAIKKD